MQLLCMSFQLRPTLGCSSVDKGGPGSLPPILQTKLKHTFELHKICKCGLFILGKIIKIVVTRSHFFIAKMHQIRFWLGLQPRPNCGSSHRSPRPSSWILGGVVLLRERRRWKAVSYTHLTLPTILRV